MRDEELGVFIGREVVLSNRSHGCDWGCRAMGGPRALHAWHAVGGGQWQALFMAEAPWVAKKIKKKMGSYKK